MRWSLAHTHKKTAVREKMWSIDGCACVVSAMEYSFSLPSIWLSCVLVAGGTNRPAVIKKPISDWLTVVFTCVFLLFISSIQWLVEMYRVLSSLFTSRRLFTVLSPQVLFSSGQFPGKQQEITRKNNWFYFWRKIFITISRCYKIGLLAIHRVYEMLSLTSVCVNLWNLFENQINKVIKLQYWT